MAKITGNCLCGSIEFSCTGEPAMTAVCHCKNCQKVSGSSYSINLGFPENDVSISGNTLTTYEDTGVSGLPVLRKFCSKCGSAIVTEVKAFPGMLFIKGGAVEDSSTIKPTAHIWTQSAQSWVTMDAGVPQVPGNPT